MKVAERVIVVTCGRDYPGRKPMEPIEKKW